MKIIYNFFYCNKINMEYYLNAFSYYIFFILPLDIVYEQF